MNQGGFLRRLMKMNRASRCAAADIPNTRRFATERTLPLRLTTICNLSFAQAFRRVFHKRRQDNFNQPPPADLDFRRCVHAGGQADVFVQNHGFHFQNAVGRHQFHQRLRRSDNAAERVISFRFPPASCAERLNPLRTESVLFPEKTIWRCFLFHKCRGTGRCGTGRWAAGVLFFLWTPAPLLFPPAPERFVHQ